MIAECVWLSFIQIVLALFDVKLTLDSIQTRCIYLGFSETIN